MAKQKKESAPPAKAPAPAAPASLFPLSSLRDDIDRAFDRMFRDWPYFGSLTAPGFFSAPFSEMAAIELRADVTEDDNAYEITAEMPGVEEKDVEVTLKDSRLTIRAEKKSEREEKKKDYHMTERSYGSFQRSFLLPEGIDADKVTAEFDKGVLTLTLPKTAEAKTKKRKVAIKAK